MANGDGTCPTCGMRDCICFSVLKNLLTKQQYYLPYTTKAIDLINDVEQLGCSCDVMNGYSCDIHIKIREIKEILLKQDISIKN